MAKTLSDRERLFCTYYHLGRCGREAAAKCGYRAPERTALRLLRRKEVKDCIDRLDRDSTDRQAEVLAGYRRLAFGCVNDAVRLLQSGDNMEELAPDELDLFLVSELKRPKGGGLEIKFFDRLKALERLEALSKSEPDARAAAFFAALGAAGKAEHCDES